MRTQKSINNGIVGPPVGETYHVILIVSLPFDLDYVSRFALWTLECVFHGYKISFPNFISNLPRNSAETNIKNTSIHFYRLPKHKYYLHLNPPYVTTHDCIIHVICS